MRRLTLAPFLLAVFALSAACAGRTPAPEPTVAAVPSLHDVKRELVGYIESGRYDADVAAVIAEARAWIERRAARGGKLAIVLDIDDTSLSTLTPLRTNDFGFVTRGPCDLPAGPCGFGAWIQMAQAEPIKPTVELARFARERGVAVFFVSGRPERMREPTEKNLRAAGFEPTGIFLKPDNAVTQSAVESKAPARKKIVDDGYTIIANVGDQMSDLDGGFAERTYKLPNPFYFVP